MKITKSDVVVLLASLLIGSFNFLYTKDSKNISVNASEAIENLYSSIPATVQGNYKYDTVSKFSFNSGSVGFVDAADYSECSYSLGYGYTVKNNDSCYYIQLPGGGYDCKLKFQTQTFLPVDTADGVLIYVDLSEPDANLSKYVGFGLGFVMMDNKYEPQSSDALWDEKVVGGHFNYYYLVEGRTCYYYDYEKGEYMPSTVIGRTMTLKEHYKGYVYMPFSSFGWRGLADADYNLLTHGFAKGFNYILYSHVLTDNLNSTDTQSRIYIDELSTVKKTVVCNHNYSLSTHIDATCQNEGMDIYVCSSCGQQMIKNHTPETEHTYNEFVKSDDSEAIRICSKCEHVDISKNSDDINNASLVNDTNTVKITIKYGLEGENTLERRVIKGKSLPVSEMPIFGSVNDGKWDYEYMAMSINDEVYTPINPCTNLHNTDRTYYAKYCISSYDNIKYTHVTNLLALTDGLYNAPMGKIVFNGNSNFSLAHEVESDFKSRGLPLINNACAGGSSYDYLYYADQLVIGYRPKILCFNLTSNDQAYWSMSEKDIASITDEYISYIHNALPTCQIAIVNSSPLPGRSEMFETIERLNAWAKNYSEGLDYVTYIDTYDFVYQRMKEYPDGWEFWTHMDTETLETWMSIICDGILKIMEEHNIVF